jgi:GNAT superfamily N-acetyltransferase
VVDATSTQARLEGHGLRLPAGMSIATFAERPDTDSAIDAAMAAVWPEFMRAHEGAAGLFGHADRDWPGFQLVLVDDTGAFVAVANSMPLHWDGDDDGLPGGWFEQGQRAVADRDAGRPPDTLGAMQIVVRPDLHGGGLSGTMVEAMKAAARSAGFKAVIACLRPTAKDRYPLALIERYGWWTRDDGLPFDPWIRLHVRLGGRIVRAAPRSMEMRGSVADWESWTGMAFPESGLYVVPRATGPLEVDRERDLGVHFDQNLWVVHDLA